MDEQYHYIMPDGSHLTLNNEEYATEIHKRSEVEQYVVIIREDEKYVYFNLRKERG